jgi:Pyruvate/2-oxoacid:ferredoxin oxidoreductase delta subunit/predicted transcriptional regulator
MEDAKMTEMTLYEQLAETVGAAGSSPIAKIFETMADENEAKVLLAASPPATVEEISQKTGIPSGEVDKIVESLFQKGLMFKSRKEDAIRYYRVRHIIQFHDATSVVKDLSPELISLWKKYMDAEWVGYREKLMGMMPKPGLRVVPVNVSIEPQSQVLAFDDVKNLIEEANTIAVTNCACRAVEGKCEGRLERCIQLNRAADYAIERGTGRKLSKQEAIGILKISEEEGLVHCASNQRGPGHVICNCCDCCCMFWGQMGYVSPSRFQAMVDVDLCSACEACLDSCHFDALEMVDENETAQVLAEKCMGCGLCLVTCPEEAISLEEIRAQEHIPQ